MAKTTMYWGGQKLKIFLFILIDWPWSEMGAHVCERGKEFQNPLHAYASAPGGGRDSAEI